MNRTIDISLAKDYRRDDLRVTRRSEPSASEPTPGTENRTDVARPRLAMLHRLVVRLA